MKFDILKNDLEKGINIAEKGINSKNLHQALSCFLISADEKLVITSMNGEISIKTEIKCNINEKGSFLVNASLFSDIIRKLGEERVNFEIEDNLLHIKSGKTHFKLAIENLEFPEFEEPAGNLSFKINSQKLKKAVQSCLVSVIEDDMRPVLRGVLFSAKKGKLDFVSLDGYRLSMVSYNEKSEIENPIEMIVPSSTLKELIKIVPDDEDISVLCMKDGIFFIFENTVFYSKLISGKYFDYSKMIEKESDIKIKVNVSDFKACLERAMILKKEGAPQEVVFTFNDGEMIFETFSENGNFTDNLAIQGDGGGLKMKFNTRYVLQGISQFYSDEVNLLLDGTLKPMIIRDDDESELYLVLPTRL